MMLCYCQRMKLDRAELHQLSTQNMVSVSNLQISNVLYRQTKPTSRRSDFSYRLYWETNIHGSRVYWAYWGYIEHIWSIRWYTSLLQLYVKVDSPPNLLAASSVIVSLQIDFISFRILTRSGLSFPHRGLIPRFNLGISWPSKCSHFLQYSAALFYACCVLLIIFGWIL